MSARILETTIRDGSYEVGFQFTLEDVAILAGLLDRAGFSLIEVGHGNGLGGHVFDGADSAASDEEYLRVARRAVKQARLGAILGFTSRSDDEILDLVRLAADTGLDFLRMGFVPSSSDSPIIVESIKLAKKLGLTVSVNFMRTYCAEPGEIAERSRRAIDRGADWIYVVDSAGGMTFDQIRRYTEAIAQTGVSEVGFHGHNNTQKALANSLVAIEAGATQVDTSLQGLGRATGNAQTEVLLTVLQELYNTEKEVDRELVYKLARRLVQPLIRAGFDPTHVLSGVFNVHSSSLPALERRAEELGLDLDALLASSASRVECPTDLEPKDLPGELVDVACAELASRPAIVRTGLDGIARHSAEVRRGIPRTLSDLLAELKVRAFRDQRRIAMLFAPAARCPSASLAAVDRDGWTFGVAPIGSGDPVDLENLPDWVSHVFVADDVAPGAAPPGSMTRFSLDDVLAEAAMPWPAPTSCLLAISNEGLRRALAARLAGVAELVVLDAFGVEPRAYQHVIAEGELGAAILSSPRQLEALEPTAVISIIGRAPLTRDVVAGLRARFRHVRVPDLFPLLSARISSRDLVRLADDQADLVDALDAGNADAVFWRGALVQAAEGPGLGSWVLVGGEDLEESDRAVALAVNRIRIASLVE